VGKLGKKIVFNYKYTKIEIILTPTSPFKNIVSSIHSSNQVFFNSEVFVFTVLRFDLASLYATKLHACFFRKYTKGRDIYDLIWYLGKELLPNFTLLNNAIEQTEGKNSTLNRDNFKEFLIRKIEEIDFIKAKKDVERFLVDKDELRLFNKINVINSKLFI
jgi:hypothetical protein